jgi:hypothetical protein
MQRNRGWASLQTSKSQISGFPTEVDSAILTGWISSRLTNTWQTKLPAHPPPKVSKVPKGSPHAELLGDLGAGKCLNFIF